MYLSLLVLDVSMGSETQQTIGLTRSQVFVAGLEARVLHLCDRVEVGPAPVACRAEGVRRWI